MACIVDGCPRPVQKGRAGYCGPHYYRFHKYGDPLAGGTFQDERPTTCVVPNCDRDVSARGRCGMHYQRWYHSAGRDSERTDVPSRQGQRPCIICVHPDRGRIEGDLVAGCHMIAVSRRYEVGLGSLRRHVPDHFPIQTPNCRCTACDHAQVYEIDELLMLRRSVMQIMGGQRVKGTLSISNIAKRYDLATDVLRHHDTPEHQARRINYELSRLNALKETA